MDTNEVVILKMLQENPEYRDNDMALLFDFWINHQHWDGSRDYFIRHCLSSETITRIRRKVQEKNGWLRGKKDGQRNFLAGIYAEKYRK